MLPVPVISFPLTQAVFPSVISSAVAVASFVTSFTIPFILLVNIDFSAEVTGFIPPASSIAFAIAVLNSVNFAIAS